MQHYYVKAFKRIFFPEVSSSPLVRSTIFGPPNLRLLFLMKNFFPATFSADKDLSHGEG